MKDEALQAYFSEAASWDIDRSGQTAQRLRIAWLVALGGWGCAGSVSVALGLPMPLKTVEPYVIRVDNATGIVDIVPMYAGRADISETVARYLLTHYITVCEGFDFITAERDYEECGAYHTARRNVEWYAQWNPVNPDSPINLYKDGTTVRAQVTAVTDITKSGPILANADNGIAVMTLDHVNAWPCLTVEQDAVRGKRLVYRLGDFLGGRHHRRQAPA